MAAEVENKADSEYLEIMIFFWSFSSGYLCVVAWASLQDTGVDEMMSIGFHAGGEG